MTDEAPPLRVLLTFDIEVWCGGWDDIDGRFPAAFRRYVYGSSRAGDYALPKTLEILNNHGLKGVFYVEPLFAAHFGIEPLAEIVGMIRAAGQEIQLHLHPEWQDEARAPLIANHNGKRQHLFMYDADEQTALIGHGLSLLKAVGVDRVSAFRAGSFACNAATFIALERNGIRFDSSLNITMPHSGADLPPGLRRLGCHDHGRVRELPMTVYRAGLGGARHAQVGACAYAELVQAMHSARQLGWRHFVILAHNSEMLLPGGNLPDEVVVSRFGKLCAFLDRHRQQYPTVDFAVDDFAEEAGGLPLPAAHTAAYLWRNAEQVARRVAAGWAGWRERQAASGRAA